MADEHAALRALLDRHQIYPADGDDLVLRVSELFDDYRLIASGKLQQAIEQHTEGMKLDKELYDKGQARRARISEHQPDWGVSFDVLDGSRERVTIPREKLWSYVEACHMLGIVATCESHDGVIHTTVKAPQSR